MHCENENVLATFQLVVGMKEDVIRPAIHIQDHILDDKRLAYTANENRNDADIEATEFGDFDRPILHTIDGYHHAFWANKGNLSKLTSRIDGVDSIEFLLWHDI